MAFHTQLCDGHICDDMITQTELKKLLHYDPDTGVLTWRDRGDRKWDARFAGREYGTRWKGRGNTHYIVGSVNYEPHRAHRLAWLYITGEWPDTIDHINGDGTDNRWCNLRNVDQHTNAKNQRVRKNNTSGVLGVSWDRANGKWSVQITVDGKVTRVGRYRDKFEAICARKSAEILHGFHENHGGVRVT